MSIIADDGVEIEHLRLQRLLATEREELAGERGCALGGSGDVLDIGAGVRVRAQLVAEQHTITDHRCEDVVEIVCDPARESADGLDFL